MAYLVDTSVLGRLANTSDPLHSVAAQAVVSLHRAGEELRAAPQVMIEFRSVATRPAAVNGLGLTAQLAEAKIASFETAFPLLDEMPGVYSAWKAIVQAAGTLGRQVHDARLVAVAQVNGVSHLLTFNVGHFTKLAAFVPGLLVVDARTV